MSMLQSTKIIIHKHLLYIFNGKFKKLTMWIKIKSCVNKEQRYPTICP